MSLLLCRPRHIPHGFVATQLNQQHLARLHAIEREPRPDEGHRADLVRDIQDLIGVLHAGDNIIERATRPHPSAPQVVIPPTLDRRGPDRLRRCGRRGAEKRLHTLGRPSLPSGRPVGRIAGSRMESRIERLCIERGLKMTGQRRVIARVLSESSDHPDVEELYRRAAALDSHISIATVYRTVRLLEENGILERRDFGGGRARYEPTEHGHHYHLIDVETGKVIEFQDAEHEQLMQAIAARLGFDLVSLRLELFGRRHEAAAPLRDSTSGASTRSHGRASGTAEDGVSQ